MLALTHRARCAQFPPCSCERDARQALGLPLTGRLSSAAAARVAGHWTEIAAIAAEQERRHPTKSLPRRDVPMQVTKLDSHTVHHRPGCKGCSGACVADARRALGLYEPDRGLHGAEAAQVATYWKNAPAVEDEPATPPADDGEKCSDCGGSGEIDRVKCERCNGTGVEPESEPEEKEKTMATRESLKANHKKLEHQIRELENAVDRRGAAHRRANEHEGTGLSAANFAALKDHMVTLHGLSEEDAGAYVRANAAKLAKSAGLKSDTAGEASKPRGIFSSNPPAASSHVPAARPWSGARAVERDKETGMPVSPNGALKADRFADTWWDGHADGTLDWRSNQAKLLLDGYARAGARLYSKTREVSRSFCARMLPNLERAARGLEPLPPTVYRRGDLKPVLVDADQSALEVMALIMRNVDPETGLDLYRDQPAVTGELKK